MGHTLLRVNVETGRARPFSRKLPFCGIFRRAILYVKSSLCAYWVYAVCYHFESYLKALASAASQGECRVMNPPTFSATVAQ